MKVRTRRLPARLRLAAAGVSTSADVVVGDAKCIHGREEINRKLIEDALRDPDDDRGERL